MTVFWNETDRRETPVYEPRTFYEATAATLNAIHAGKVPFEGTRWQYLADDLGWLRRYVATLDVGKIIDLGCGAGQWADHYIDSASEIALVDFSTTLLERAAQRVARLKHGLPLETMAVDIFANFEKLPLDGKTTVLCAFLLSHYEVQQVVGLLQHLRIAIGPNTQIIVIDSWYSPTRSLRRERETVRSIDVNGKRVSVLKHYFTRQEWEEIAKSAGLTLSDQWWGKAFFLCRCIT